VDSLLGSEAAVAQSPKGVEFYVSFWGGADMCRWLAPILSGAIDPKATSAGLKSPQRSSLPPH
jgi:hypothetical protein